MDKMHLMLVEFSLFVYLNLVYQFFLDILYLQLLDFL